MTEKDLKSMYDKISLSETRMTELEKKLPEMFAEAENKSENGDELLMHFDGEYKPMKRSRRGVVIGSCTAAAVVLAAGLGLYAAYHNGMLPIVPKDAVHFETTSEAVPETHEPTANGLEFRTDKAGLDIFESHFLGTWAVCEEFRSSLGVLELSYDGFCGIDGVETTCSGFAESENLYVMLINVNSSGDRDYYCIQKNNGQTMYQCTVKGESVVSAEVLSERIANNEYTGEYRLGSYSEDYSSEIRAPMYIGYLGRMKLKAELDDEGFSEVLDEIFISGSAEFDGRTWNRAYIRPADFGVESEEDRLIALDEGRISLTIRLYDSEADTFITEPLDFETGMQYDERPVCRDFQADIVKNDGVWEYSLTPLSGSTDDMDNFWSPESKTDFVPTIYRLENEEVTGVAYYAVPYNNGMKKVYGVQTVTCEIDGEFAIRYRVFYRNPVYDEYVFLFTLQAEGFSVAYDGETFVWSGINDENKWQGGSSTNETFGGNALEKGCTSTEVYIRGDYIIVKKYFGDDVKWEVYDKQTMRYAVTYDENDLVMYDDDFHTFESYWTAHISGCVENVNDGSGIEIYHNGSGIHSELLKTDSRARSMWWSIYVSSTKQRTREEMLEYLETVLTPEAAEATLEDMLKTDNYQEINGVIVTNGGMRNEDLSIGAVVPNVTSTSEDGRSGELTYTVYYNSYEDDYHVLPETDTYTIPWELTENGIRLGKLYYPL